MQSKGMDREKGTGTKRKEKDEKGQLIVTAGLYEFLIAG